MHELGQREFVKGLAVIGIGGLLPSKFIYNALKRDYVEELRNKLEPYSRFSDVEMARRGYKNIMFGGYTVTNERVSGSIWDDSIRGAGKARNRLIRALS